MVHQVASSGDSADIFQDQGTLLNYFRREDPSDVAIISADGVVFPAHRKKLLAKSTNFFANLLLENERSIIVAESSEVFNLLFCIFYDLDPSDHNPSLEQVSSALVALPKYGLSLEIATATGTHVYNLIMGLASKSSIDTFALVCHHNLERLATDISQLLISIPIHDLNDQQCTMMGPVYLRRLVFLQVGRTERLKEILNVPPTKHEPTMSCDAVNQRRNLEAVWDDAVRELVWEVKAHTSVSLLHTAITPAVDRVTCADCKTAIRERIKQIIVDWTLVKSTI